MAQTSLGERSHVLIVLKLCGAWLSRLGVYSALEADTNVAPAMGSYSSGNIFASL